ncbi:MAG TPA: hypothetical protein VFV59_08215 [Candidatus Limnocylindria bacterium]|jgi:hypothetical protein|nr:hypothetical protein [Candidatus Limnocylindria bacterium]HEU5325854.1 hypothetical protein [Candidatus Limnocylindria bacterium]
MQQVQPGEWRRFGFGGPPEPWEHGAQRDLDRLATSYYLDILGSRRAILAACRDEALRDRVEELFTTAERHKHEIDYTLRHWATPVERARVEDRLGSLMRAGIRLREIRESLPSSGPISPAPEPMPAA